MLQRISALVFIVGFFSAPPLWWFSTFHGKVLIHCGIQEGYLCFIKSSNFITEKTESFIVETVSVKKETASFRFKSSDVYILQINGTDITDYLEQEDAYKFHDQILENKNMSMKYSTAVEPGLSFWISASLVILFAVIGFLLWLKGGKKE